MPVLLGVAQERAGEGIAHQLDQPVTGQQPGRLQSPEIVVHIITGNNPFSSNPSRSVEICEFEERNRDASRVQEKSWQKSWHFLKRAQCQFDAEWHKLVVWLRRIVCGLPGGGRPIDHLKRVRCCIQTCNRFFTVPVCQGRGQLNFAFDDQRKP